MFNYWNILKLFVSSGLLQALNFIIVIIYSNYYDNSVVANYSKIAALIGFSTVVIEFGCNQLIISRSHVNKLKELIYIRTFSFLLYMAIFYVAANDIFNLYGIDRQYLPLFFIYSVTLTLVSSFSYYFQGRAKLNYFNYFQYGRGIFHLLIFIIYLLVFKCKDPIYDWLLFGSIINILFIVFGFIKIPKKTDSYSGVTWSHSFNYFIAAISVMVILRCDALFLGTVSDDELAVFFQAKTIALIISLLSSSISNYYMVRVKDYACLSWDDYKNNIFKMLLVAIPFAFLIMIISIILLPYIYGKSYVNNMNSVYIILSLSYLFGLIINPLSVLILRAEHSLFSLKLNVAQASATVLFSYLFFSYGSIGLAFAISISYMLSFVIVLVYVRKNYAVFASKIME